MAYADAAYYTNTWHGTYAGSDLAVLLDRAADVLDATCLNSIDITVLTPTQLNLLKKANCAQADYIVNTLGGTDGMSGSTGGSFHIGSYSETNSDGAGASSACAVSAQAGMYLFGAGLGYRGLP